METCLLSLKGNLIRTYELIFSFRDRFNLCSRLLQEYKDLAKLLKFSLNIALNNVESRTEFFSIIE